MRANGIGAVLIEPGSSLVYFTGIRWGRSERAMLAVLPVEGEPCIVSPFFEEPRMRETLGIPAEVRVWQEDEDPLKLVAGFLRIASSPRGRSGSRKRCASSSRDRLGARAARREDRVGQSGRARLPDDQDAGRTRADADGDRHHHRRLSLDLSADRKGHDRARYRRADGRRDRASWAATPNSA